MHRLVAPVLAIKLRLAPAGPLPRAEIYLHAAAAQPR
eukprot:COSAG03_NODE_8835_length_766_cov_128.193403_1_plen_36_part_10